MITNLMWRNQTLIDKKFFRSVIMSIFPTCLKWNARGNQASETVKTLALGRSFKCMYVNSNIGQRDAPSLIHLLWWRTIFLNI